MSLSTPYQPILLRILHGAIAILTFLALISGFWVYNTYDKRWGSLNLPRLDAIQDIHGTIALTFLLILPVFVLYSFRIGYRRLVQEQSFQHLTEIGKPIWWVSIYRIANTLTLLSATLAVITGRMMKEEWLPAGEIFHPWYIAHVTAWFCVLISVAFHLLLGTKIGGVSLLISMFNWQKSSEDKLSNWLKEIRVDRASKLLKIIEILIIVGIILAFILPLFN
ncbi:MAG: cytochrome b/b6 domain-containing protein [Microcystaceae cyanobacterium]